MQKTDEHQSTRWKVLMLSCAVLCGQYYCYDIPAVVHDHLSAFSGLGSKDFSWFFNSLYSAYSLPNLILPLFFGYTIDKRSSASIVCILAVITCAGQACVTTGVIRNMPWLAISGRFIFGVGSESMGVAQNAILTHYFEKKEIAFALALNVSFSRLGTILNDWISPLISSAGGVSAAFSFGLASSVVSLICALELARTVRVNIVTPNISSDSSMTMFIASTRSLSAMFWLVTAICIGGYICILPFISVFTAARPTDLNQAEAGQIVSIAFVICAIITPIFGKFVDRFGRATWMLTAACFLLCLTHILFKNYSHFAVIITLGVAYAAFVASIWPLVPLTVPGIHVGLAYGIMASFQNGGLTIMPMLIAAVRYVSDGYTDTRWLFFVTSLITLSLSTWLAAEFHILIDRKDILDPERESLKSEIQSSTTLSGYVFPERFDKTD